MVYYNNSSYVAKKLTVGNPPADNSEYWQALAKVPVSAVLGVKGNAESAYRTGNVNLTAANIGLGKVNNTADADKNVATANQVNGTYTGSGGQQPPSYVTSGKTRFNMMTSFKGFTNPAGGYMDVILMDNYNGGDVPYVTGIGVTKNNGNPRMFIANGEKGSTGNWAHQVEVITSSNISSQNIASSTKATQDGNGNVIADTYAKKSIYDDNAVSRGRKEGTTVGGGSFSFGINSEATGAGCFSIGHTTKASSSYNSGYSGYSYAEGILTEANATASHAEGYHTIASNLASHSLGKYNKPMGTIGDSSHQVGDVFVIGNGYDGITSPSGTMLSNALRVTYTGDIYGTKAFQSSGADYAEFIKPWADGNPENEDRVGYFVTVKDGFLHKANEGDYIVGITSGNPSIVGNADEDYYWRYERDEFNRIVLEDVPETVQKTDEEGNPVFEGETHQPVMIETGKIIPNARMKLSKDYDPTLQQNYIERKDRKEWDYVGMLGVLPVRDDGTCQPGQFCKCGRNGIATLANTRGFDTYTVLERISDSIVSVILK